MMGQFDKLDDLQRNDYFRFTDSGCVTYGFFQEVLKHSERGNYRLQFEDDNGEIREMPLGQVTELEILVRNGHCLKEWQREATA